MVGKKKTIFLVAFLLITLAPLNGGCAPRNTNNQTSNSLTTSRFPTKSFAKVYSLFEIKKCKKDSKLCRVGNIGSSGSAIAVKKSKTKIIFLTASHVCKNSLPQEVLKEIEEYEESIVVQLYNKKYYKTEIINYTEIESSGVDLCTLKLEHSDSTIEAVPMATEAPRAGDVIYSLSAPLGIYHPPTVPIFSGIYSGPILSQKVSLTTIPAAGGSSGSAVLNTKMEIVGVLFATHPEFKFISIITNLDVTKEFLDLKPIQCK